MPDNHQILLLTGASGFLGNFMEKYLASTYQIVTLGRSKSSDIPCDLSSQVPVINWSHDLVIHCAGKAHTIPHNRYQEKEFYQINVEGTQNLLKGIEPLSRYPQSFIFISTVAVHGREEGELIDEWDPLYGVTPYGQSKIQAEKLLLEWGEKNHVKIGILRLPLVAGKNPPGNLGSMIEAIKSGKYFRIGQGEAIKSMVVIDDVIKYIPRVAEVGGIYNLTDGYHPSFQEIEDTIASVIGKKILSIPYPLAKILALVGDLVGDVFPLNSDTLKKITNTLTYSDARAREKLDWDPQPALTYLKEIVH